MIQRFGFAYVTLVFAIDSVILDVFVSATSGFENVLPY